LIGAKGLRDSRASIARNSSFLQSASLMLLLDFLAMTYVTKEEGKAVIKRRVDLVSVQALDPSG
jgi:hypothetical protein